jgi:outer membrane immunogenic protein
MHISRTYTTLSAATLLTLGLSVPAQAQTQTPTPTPTPAPAMQPSSTSGSHPWKGLHIGLSLGAAILSDGSNNTLVFDKNLDGSFDDTVLTSGGVNAFSPGFCSGESAGNTPTQGCSKQKAFFEYSGRVGYDWQKGRLVFGIIAELTELDVADAVTGFSTTPLYYTFKRDAEWMLTAGARLGVAGDKWLLYAQAAPAWANLDHRFATSSTQNTFVKDADDNVGGLQLGGGLDFRIASRVTLGAFYAFTSLKDTDKFTVRAQGPAAATNAFILANANGTDIRRADKLQWHSIRGVVGIRF